TFYYNSCSNPTQTFAFITVKKRGNSDYHRNIGSLPVLKQWPTIPMVVPALPVLTTRLSLRNGRKQMLLSTKTRTISSHGRISSRLSRTWKAVDSTETAVLRQ